METILVQMPICNTEQAEQTKHEPNGVTNKLIIPSQKFSKCNFAIECIYENTFSFVYKQLKENRNVVLLAVLVASVQPQVCLSRNYNN